jgi:formylglycine-generating enzyme required for sulfatase activity
MSADTARTSACARSKRSRVAYALILVLAALGAAAVLESLQTDKRASGAAAGQHCDRDTSNLRRPAAASGIQPAQPPSQTAASHDGMVWISGGEYWMGAQMPDLADAHPVHRVTVDGFWMDKTAVTNQQFAQFVAATTYVTEAERELDRKQFPGVPLEKLKPGGVVFTPPSHATPLEDASAWWAYVPGANWRHPDGPASGIQGKEKYPVVQVTWSDAVAYAKWAHKRLPTEAEFEYAARGGLDRQPYAWGSEWKPGGKWQANLFQGHFPERDTAEDGYAGRAPVASFPPNRYGLHDITGNVWQWCADWYRPDYYRTALARNPRGPADSYDPLEPGVSKRVQRGGSFLCTDQYCARYIVGSRGKGDPDTPTSHAGFRCVTPDSKTIEE